MSGMYVESLMRCSCWDATGGKSKAGFFKTTDDQLVIKQLASKWTNQEKAALLKFAPAYFEYMDGSDKVCWWIVLKVSPVCADTEHLRDCRILPCLLRFLGSILSSIRTCKPVR